MPKVCLLYLDAKVFEIETDNDNMDEVMAKCDEEWHKRSPDVLYLSEKVVNQYNGAITHADQLLCKRLAWIEDYLVESSDCNVSFVHDNSQFDKTKSDKTFQIRKRSN